MAIPIETFLPQQFTNYLVTLIIPFLIFFTILLFVLKRTKVFGSGNLVYVIISLGLTVMIYAIKPDVFGFLASYLFQIGIAGSIIVLGGIFIMVFFALIRKGESIAKSLKSNEQRLQDLRKDEEKLLKQIHGSVFPIGTGKRMQKLKELKDVEEEVKRLELYLRAKKRWH